MDSRKRPTLADVARVAEVAPMTVSRVLTGSANVKAPMAERVRKAVEMLRYQPNETARALRGHRSRTIGLIVPKLSESFFAICAQSINEVAKRHGYSVIFTTSNDSREAEYAQAQMMVQRGVEGLVVIPGTGYRSNLIGSDLQRLPVVSLDRPLDDTSFDSVLVQNREGGKLAVQHLIEHGYQEIVLCSEPSSIYTLQERREGYRDAMDEAGLAAEYFLKCDSVEETTSFLRNRLRLKKRKLALFASNETAGVNCLRAIPALGLKIPDDVAIVCFDDFPLADIVAPGITVVRQPLEQIGRLAADMLFEQVEHEELKHEGTTVSLPVELVIRRSCGCP